MDETELADCCSLNSNNTFETRTAEVRKINENELLWLDFGVIVQQQNMITLHMKTNYSKAIIFQPTNHNQV